jgi:hypothetical protein
VSGIDGISSPQAAAWREHSQVSPFMRADDTKGEERPYSPFRMGLQSYSLRRYTKDGRPDVKQALEATRQRLAP